GSDNGTMSSAWTFRWVLGTRNVPMGFPNSIRVWAPFDGPSGSWSSRPVNVFRWRKEALVVDTADEDPARGCLTGLALGDALGTTRSKSLQGKQLGVETIDRLRPSELSTL